MRSKLFFRDFPHELPGFRFRREERTGFLGENHGQGLVVGGEEDSFVMGMMVEGPAQSILTKIGVPCTMYQ
jgi:hypothetical protein